MFLHVPVVRQAYMHPLHPWTALSSPPYNFAFAKAMVAKGKARAVWKVQGAKKVLAKGKAKAKAKPTGKAQAKGKAKTTGQIQQKARAVHKENLKEQINTMTNPGKPSLQPTSRAGNGRGKGWEEIQEGDSSLTHRGCMVVLDKCRQLAKKGNPQLLEAFKALPRGPAKVEFALQLKVDREGAWLVGKEKHSSGTSFEQTWVTGWLTEAQVAQQEGLVSWSTCPKQAKLLETFLEGLPSKPHDRGDLAAQGVKLYEYRKQNLDELQKNTRVPGFHGSAQADHGAGAL